MTDYRILDTTTVRVKSRVRGADGRGHCLERASQSCQGKPNHHGDGSVTVSVPPPPPSFVVPQQLAHGLALLQLPAMQVPGSQECPLLFVGISPDPPWANKHVLTWYGFSVPCPVFARTCALTPLSTSPNPPTAAHSILSSAASSLVSLTDAGCSFATLFVKDQKTRFICFVDLQCADRFPSG